MLEAILASSFVFSKRLNLLPVVSEHLMTPFYRRTVGHLLWDHAGSEHTARK